MTRRTYCIFELNVFMSLSVSPSSGHLMFLGEVALGSVTQVLVDFPGVAAGGG